MKAKNNIVNICKELLNAYKNGLLGPTVMPEDTNPGFDFNKDKEFLCAYFTLPMALNYQRNSFALWEAALKTWNDKQTRIVFNVKKVSEISEDDLRSHLTKYKLALQPNKHVRTWKTISETVYKNFGSFEGLFEYVNNDFLNLKNVLQVEHKKGFPYLSGPKIFNYWSFILMQYSKIQLKNAEYIDIAPDTHITKCSVKLGVITQEESIKLSKDQISEIWRNILKNSGILPIQMHAPLWFWSHNGFIYDIGNKMI